MRKFCTLMISALLVLLLCACSSHGDDESNSDNDAYEGRLSESCDAVLCTAVDDSGNNTSWWQIKRKIRQDMRSPLG